MSNVASKLHVLHTSHLRHTKNRLSTGARHASIEVLNGLLAPCIDVALSARHAHWNVRGPQFQTLRDVFDRAAVELNEHIDSMAERIAALGGLARGTVQQVASETTLKSMPVFSLNELEFVEELSDRLGHLSDDLRDAVMACEVAGDPVTSDVLVEACAAVDVLLWQIESHAVKAHSA